MRRKLFGPRSRSASALLNAPRRRWLWSLLIVLDLVVAIAAEAARHHSRLPRSLDWIPPMRWAFDLWDRDLGSVGRSVGMALLVLGFGYFAYRLRLAFLVRRPGPVDVQQLTATSAVDAPVDELSTAFREALERVQLRSSTGTVPGVAPQSGFLDVLTTVGAETGPLASVAGFMRAITGFYAYRVAGELRTRVTGEQRCGITVSVTAAPSGGVGAVTVWARTWPAAIDKAAYAVGASILPLTRLIHRAPWHGWQGTNLPSRLFADYMGAKALQADHRYDEALHKLYRALQEDPLNLHIRLEIGQLQEQLHLFLDALKTYDDIITLTTRKDDHQRWFIGYRLHRLRYVGRRRPDYTTRRSRRGLHSVVSWRRSSSVHSAAMAARYRYALVLGFSEVFVAQWVKGGPEEPNRTARDLERDRLRESLLPRLGAYCFEPDPATEGLPRGPGAAEEILRSVTPRDPQEKTEEEKSRYKLLCRSLLQQASKAELARLHRDYRWYTGRRRWGAPLSSRALDLVSCCADVRLMLVERLVRREFPKDGHKKVERSPKDELARLRKRIRAILGPIGLSRRGFQEYYNAACAYSLPLLFKDSWVEATATGREAAGSADLDAAMKGFAEAAVRSLERAIDVSDSHFVAARRDWMSVEDPDLVGLRFSQEYVEFRTRNLPAPTAAERLPENVHELQVAAYVADILKALSSQMQRNLGELLPAKLAVEENPLKAIATVNRYLEIDEQSWSALVDLARDRRDWRARFTVLRHVQKLAPDTLSPVLTYPLYPDDRIGTLNGVEDSHRGEAAAVAVEKRDEVVTRLARVVDEASGRLGPTIGPGDRPEMWRKVIAARIQGWQAIDDCLAPDFLPSRANPLQPDRDEVPEVLVTTFTAVLGRVLQVRGTGPAGAIDLREVVPASAGQAATDHLPVQDDS